MTHKERLLALLTDFGVTPDEESRSHEGVAEQSVTLEALKGGVEGFLYFRCEFVFNSDDSFRSVGVWE